MINKDYEKILNYMRIGVDWKVCLLELIKHTGDKEFVSKAEDIINYQTPKSKIHDIQDKIIRLHRKAEILEEHDLSDKEVIMNAYMATHKRMEVELNKL